ncbi:hypothetical protein DICPUDRAFT_37398 [Dictyostelium purpureum]|uniref:Rab GTPase n=1 Tax=Dictyostelium purpureum TaxID=5786 RepID=F0ZSS1_DICPU|nr:uncharacterized protein DICPUDRAFT_37398 [Dictyostelium purpureum]EGC33004.1 hypothetical protein DICPUDRAFT_37398 [Dictyostelium purpureum]|eukprot:XP_003290474.1 hypothetical protein DICPUDRAFT_37398 [Dictyostelium purpureum]
MEKTIVKIILVGDLGVGKTSLTLRYTEDRFDSENSFILLDQDFKIKEFLFDRNVLRVYIWDTFGQEKFKTIGVSFYRGVNGTVLVFDITNRASFERCITFWFNEAKRYTRVNSEMVLIGTKLDLVEHKIAERAVSYEEAKSFADEMGIQYLETSSKYNLNVTQLYADLINGIVESQNVFEGNNHNYNKKNCIIN